MSESMGRRRKIAYVVLTASALLVALALWSRRLAFSARAAAVDVGTATSSAGGSSALPLVATSRLPITGQIHGLTVGDVSGIVFALEDPLSSLADERCGSVPGCTELLIDCGCEEALERLSEGVLLHDHEQPRRFEAVPEDDGSFVLPVPAGRFMLWARQGRKVAALGKVASGTRDVQLRLQPAVTLLGRVVGPGEKGVAGARVVAVQAGLVVRAVSDRDGRVALNDVPDGEWEAVALAPGLLGAKDVFRGSRYVQAEFELRLPAPLYGTVLREGKPVAAAEIALHRGHCVARMTSNSLGTFAFERLRPEPVRLLASEGGQCATATVTPLLGEGPREPVVLTLGTCSTISGTVAGVDGERLAGALISIGDGALGDAKEATRSGPDGSFRFLELPTNWDHLEVELEGFERIDETRAISATAPLSIILRPAAACAGVVRDALDSRPVAGADIRLIDPRNAHRWLESTRTAADGTFRFAGAPAGEVVLEVDDDRYLPLKTLISLPNANLQVLVDPGTAIEGRVFDPTGAPCVKASFEVSGRGGFHSETDLQGRYRISGLWRGRHRVEVTPPADMAALPASAELVVGGQGTIALDFHLDASELLSGIVLDEEGRPVAGAGVRAFGEAKPGGARPASRPSGHAESGADGTFAMRQLPAGSYSVEVSADAFDDLLTTGRTGKPLTLRLTRGRSWVLLRGRILSPEGAPVTDFELHSGARHAVDGRFEERLWPEFQDSFEVKAKGYVPLSRPIPAAEGETADLGDLVLSRGAIVSGTVVEAGSLRPLEGAVVVPGELAPLQETFEFIEHPNEGILSWLSSRPRVSKDGTFRFEHVDTQSTHLLVFERNHRPELLLLPADRENVRVALRRGAEIRGTVKDQEPGALERTLGWVRTAHPKLVMHVDYLRPEEPRRVPLDASGAFRVSGLSPGRYEVTAERIEDESVVYAKTEVEVAADGVATAVVSRRQGLDLMLRVFEVDGSVPKYPRAQIVRGDVPLPESAVDREQIDRASEWATRLREGHGFPALVPGVYTLFVLTWQENAQRAHREVIDVAHDRQLVEVRLVQGLPTFVSSQK